MGRVLTTPRQEHHPALGPSGLVSTGSVMKGLMGAMPPRICGLEPPLGLRAKSWSFVFSAVTCGSLLILTVHIAINNHDCNKNIIIIIISPNVTQCWLSISYITYSSVAQPLRECQISTISLQHSSILRPESWNLASIMPSVRQTETQTHKSADVSIV